MTDWTSRSAAALGRGIGSGEIDPVALTQAFLDRIAAHPLRDRIYARLTPDRALAEARERAALELEVLTNTLDELEAGLEGIARNGAAPSPSSECKTPGGT